MKNQWQVTANAAELYEELLVPTGFKPWAEDLLALAALREGDRVLDVACGTGIVARMAAERVGEAGAVTGLDLNPGMIRVARSVPAPSGAPVTWVEGSALKMPLPDVSFDVVLCQKGSNSFRISVPGCRNFDACSSAAVESSSAFGKERRPTLVRCQRRSNGMQERRQPPRCGRAVSALIRTLCSCWSRRRDSATRVFARARYTGAFHRLLTSCYAILPRPLLRMPSLH